MGGSLASRLNAPGKFLISTPEHTTPRRARARAYRIDDHDVATIAARHAPHRPRLDAPSRDAVTPTEKGEPDAEDDVLPMGLNDPAALLWAALLDAPEDGRSVRELMAATGMGRTWVYERLQTFAEDGRVTQVARGRWTVTAPEKPR